MKTKKSCRKLFGAVGHTLGKNALTVGLVGSFEGYLFDEKEELRQNTW